MVVSKDGLPCRIVRMAFGSRLEEILLWVWGLMGVDGVEFVGVVGFMVYFSLGDKAISFNRAVCDVVLVEIPFFSKENALRDSCFVGVVVEKKDVLAEAPTCGSCEGVVRFGLVDLIEVVAKLKETMSSL